MVIRVLVVEDEEIAATAHATYLTRLPGFEVAGIAASGADALRILGEVEVDLVLLDFHLPDGHGLRLLQRIRAAGHGCDVVAVTSARDLDVVKRAMTQGVAFYLLKPFTFAGFRAKLGQYSAFRSQLGQSESQLVQDEVDQLIGMLRPAGPQALPKGMSAETLRTVTDCLRGATEARSASQVAAAVGTSRVTARRYLEHLADTGLVRRRSRYGGGGGRPEVEYAWQHR